MKINNTEARLDTSREFKVHSGIYLKPRNNIFSIDTAAIYIFFMSQTMEQGDS